MARRDRPEEEDYGEFDRPRKSNAAMWIALAAVIGVGGVAAVIVCFALLFVARSAPRPANAPAPTVTTGPVGATKQGRDREDLKALVMGKSMDEVKALLGVPESTREVAGQDVWRYEGISRDRVTGKTDRSAHIYFTDGKVTDILF